MGIKHGRFDQQRRRTLRHECRVGFDQMLDVIGRSIEIDFGIG
jgi:hypothetical protein